MALKRISYKMRWRKHGVICGETQRDICYFKKQVAPNHEMKWYKQNRTSNPLLSSFRKLHGQRPMGFQQGRIGLSLRYNRSLFENELGFMTLLISNNKIISITTNQFLPITTHQSRTYHSPLSSERGWGWGFFSLSSFASGIVVEALFPLTSPFLQPQHGLIAFIK